MPAVRIDVQKTDDARDVVHQAVQALAEGHLVVFPTETVYGVAASALNESATLRLREIKGRAKDSPFALAIKSAGVAQDYVPNMAPLAQRLARRCWPGPLTMVLEDSHEDGMARRLPAGIRQAVAPENWIGLRVPAHPLILAVLRLSAGPLALTSANLSGQPDAVTADEVLGSLGEQVSLVLDDGRCKFAQPSTVVRVDENGLHLLREGVFNEKSLRRMAGLMIVLVCTGNTCRSPMAGALLQEKLARRLQCDVGQLEERGVLVTSAGIAAMAGERASPEAVRTMSERGVPLEDHESQPLTERLVRFADLVLTMTRGHRDAICGQWPEAQDRVHLLCQSGSDVHDPIGGPSEVYQQCADQIDAELDAWIDRMDLDHLVSSHSGD